MIEGQIKFRHLQCFMAVAESGSLQKAAGRLAITQPAVSKTLKELEGLLSVQLFERGRRGAVLTPPGIAFSRHAGASVSALRDAVASVAPCGGGVGATLAIGLLPTVVACIAMPLLRELDAANSPTSLRLVTGSNPDLLTRLRERDIDLVIGRFAEPAQMAGLSFEHLYADPLVLAVRPGHPLASAKHSPPDLLARLRDFTLILPMAGTAIRQAADNFLLARGLGAARRTIETLSVDLARDHTAASDAIWFVPSGAAEWDFGTGSLVRLPVDTAGTEELVGISLRADMTATPEQAEVLALIRRLARSRRESGTSVLP
jgi:LysR family transcriptional regulator, pca operon transcriptional activator